MYSNGFPTIFQKLLLRCTARVYIFNRPPGNFAYYAAAYRRFSLSLSVFHRLAIIHIIIIIICILYFVFRRFIVRFFKSTERVHNTSVNIQTVFNYHSVL